MSIRKRKIAYKQTRRPASKIYYLIPRIMHLVRKHQGNHIAKGVNKGSLGWKNSYESTWQSINYLQRVSLILQLTAVYEVWCSKKLWTYTSPRLGLQEISQVAELPILRQQATEHCQNTTDVLWNYWINASCDCGFYWMFWDKQVDAVGMQFRSFHYSKH